MSFDNTKYDVELNSVPYRIRGYQKSELSTFIPRFGAGNQNESQFDLLRARTVKGFEGGILQRYFNEENSIFGSEHLYPIFDDGTLYPVNSVSSATDIMGKSEVTAHAKNKDYQFLAILGFTGSPSIKRINTSGAIASITLPVSCDTRITSMVIKDT